MVKLNPLISNNNEELRRRGTIQRRQLFLFKIIFKREKERKKSVGPTWREGPQRVTKMVWWWTFGAHGRRNKRRWVGPSVPDNISRRSRTPCTRVTQRVTRGPGRACGIRRVARVVVVGSRIRFVLEKKNWWDQVSERTYPMLKNCSHITLHRFPAKTNCDFLISSYILMLIPSLS